jgi:hypothetical protein
MLKRLTRKLSRLFATTLFSVAEIVGYPRLDPKRAGEWRDE